jgi:hypothetical protein
MSHDRMSNRMTSHSFYIIPSHSISHALFPLIPTLSPLGCVSSEFELYSVLYINQLVYDVLPQFKSLVVLGTTGVQYTHHRKAIRSFIVLVVLAALPAPLIIVVLVWCLGRSIIARLTIASISRSWFS